MHHVALVGLGNLGSRHLQGLVSCKYPLEISLLDPSSYAIARAQERWAEAGGEKSPHRIVDSGRYDFGLAIVATTADHRLAAIEGLKAKARVAKWLLEKPLSQSLSDLERLRSLIQEPAWVNLARRSIPWHQEMARVMQSCEGPLSVSVNGGPWGLASNALHFADMVQWWTGGAVTYVDTSELDGEWHESKRQGYSEIFGTLRLDYSDGSDLTLISSLDGGPHQISVATRGGDFVIDEKSGVMRRPEGPDLKGPMAFQSGLTGGVVQQIIRTEKSVLPTFAKVVETEQTLLSALIVHRAAHGGSTDRLDVT